MQYSGINSMLDMSHTAVNTYDVQTLVSYKGVWSEFDLTPFVTGAWKNRKLKTETDTEMDGGHGNGKTQAIITSCSVVLLCLYSVLYIHGLRMMHEKSRGRWLSGKFLPRREGATRGKA